MKVQEHTDAELQAARRSFRSDGHRAVFEYALKLGWTWRITGGTHLLMRAPNGDAHVSLSMSAIESWRGVKNAEAVVKRWERIEKGRES